jgi:hypothetical protein
MSGFDNLSPVNQSAFDSEFFASLGIHSKPDFISVINQKVNGLKQSEDDVKLPSGTVYYAATVCVKELIKRMLIKEKDKMKSKNPGLIANIDARMGILEKVKPPGNVSPLQLGKYDEGKNPPEVPVGFYPEKPPSYTNFLNEFFQVKLGSEKGDGTKRSKKWRDLLSHAFPDDQTQCIKALQNIEYGLSVREYQDLCVNDNEGKCLNCYICGLPIKKDDVTMECEHILSFATAISHFGLIQKGQDEGERFEQVRAEYAWSHACCNGIKSNFEFVKFQSPRYEIDLDAINQMLKDISKSTNQDCSKLLPKEDIGKNQQINVKVQPLIDQINRDMLSFPTIEYYIAFTTFKLLAALSSDALLNIIVQDVEVVEVLRKLGDREKAAQEKRAREEAVILEAEKGKELIRIRNIQRNARAAARGTWGPDEEEKKGGGDKDGEEQSTSSEGEIEQLESKLEIMIKEIILKNNFKGQGTEYEKDVDGYGKEVDGYEKEVGEIFDVFFPDIRSIREIEQLFPEEHSFTKQDTVTKNPETSVWSFVKPPPYRPPSRQISQRTMGGKHNTKKQRKTKAKNKRYPKKTNKKRTRRHRKK